MPKTFRIIALSLVGLALLLAIIAIGIGKRGASTSPTVQPTDVQAGQAPSRPSMLVAARALTAGKPVAIDDLKHVEVDTLPAGHYTNAYQVAGALPSRDIAADTPLHPELFLRGLSSHLQTGERAIAVAVDEISGVGNRVEPGDYVDVFLALPETGTRNDSERMQPLTRLLASRLRVLSYGQNSVASESAPEAESAPAAASSEATTGKDQERAQAITARSNAGTGYGQSSARPASSAVLAVPPDQAGALLLGAQSGKLFLALRNPADTSVADVSRFAEPAAVLAIAANPAADSAQPPSADDRAYAGLALPGLTGKSTARAPAAVRPAVAAGNPRPARRPASSGGGIQIIRGGDAPRPLTTH